jgi:sialic acid synthase SpsE
MREYLGSNEPYVIAETAYTFEGDFIYLLQQTKGLDKKINAIKFHVLFDIDEYMVKSHSVYPLLRKWLIKPEQWIEIFTLAKSKKHDVIVLADDTETIDFCMKNDNLVDGLEIHAACVNDKNLVDRAIDFCINKGKTFILGISGFEIQELFDIIEYIKLKGTQDVLLMYGFQNFPTNINEINIRKMQLLEELLGFKVGYADHTEFSNPSKDQVIKAAYCLGSNILEIHYVINEGVERTDYITGVSSERLRTIYDDLDMINRALGVTDLRMNEGEQKYLRFRKVPVAKRDLKQGETISDNDVAYKRVESPNKQHHFHEDKEIIGSKTIEDTKCDSEITKYE